MAWTAKDSKEFLIQLEIRELGGEIAGQTYTEIDGSVQHAFDNCSAGPQRDVERERRIVLGHSDHGFVDDVADQVTGHRDRERSGQRLRILGHETRDVADPIEYFLALAIQQRT